MNRLTNRRRISTVSGIVSVVLIVSACAERTSSLEPTAVSSLAAVGAAQLVTWTGDGAPGGFCTAAASGATRTWSFLLTSPDEASSSLTARFHEDERAVSATLTAFVDNNLVLTADTPGSSGNLISARIVDPGAPNSPLVVQWIGTQLTVTLSTDGAGRPTSTAQHVIAAVNANPASVVTATLANGSDGSGIVQAHGETQLAGGDVASAASLALTSNDDVRFTAAAAGAAGNAASVAIIDAGSPNAPLMLQVGGSQLNVSLGTNASGAVITTAQHLISAIAALVGSPVSAASLAGNDGTGRVRALAATSLTGGGSEAVINEYLVAGVKKGGGRSPFGYAVTTIANARLLSATASGGSPNSNLTVVSCD